MFESCIILHLHTNLFLDVLLESFYGQSSNQQRSGIVPPRMQQQQPQQQQQQQQQSIQQQDGSANRPKRYSSLRQRSTVSDNPGPQNYPPQHGQHGQHNQHNQHNQHGQHGQHGYFPPQGNKIQMHSETLLSIKYVGE